MIILYEVGLLTSDESDKFAICGNLYFSNLNNSIQPCSLWKYLQIWLANCNQIHWEGIHFGTIQKAYQSRNKICKIPYNSITIFDELISKNGCKQFFMRFFRINSKCDCEVSPYSSWLVVFGCSSLANYNFANRCKAKILNQRQTNHKSFNLTKLKKLSQKI